MAQELCPIAHFYGKELNKTIIFVQIFPFLTTNKIKYVLYDGTNFQYDKSSKFVELMLES